MKYLLDKLSDRITAVFSSWAFLGGQNFFIACWMAWNTLAPITLRFDPPPFIGLNLFMSWEAANATPVIMMSQNRHEALMEDHRAKYEETMLLLMRRLDASEEITNRKLDLLLRQAGLLPASEEAEDPSVSRLVVDDIAAGVLGGRELP